MGTRAPRVRRRRLKLQLAHLHVRCYTHSGHVCVLRKDQAAMRLCPTHALPAHMGMGQSAPLGPNGTSRASQPHTQHRRFCMGKCLCTCACFGPWAARTHACMHADAGLEPCAAAARPGLMPPPSSYGRG